MIYSLNKNLNTIPTAITLVKYGIKNIVSQIPLCLIFSNIVTAINIDIIRPTGTTTNENNAVFPIAS